MRRSILLLDSPNLTKSVREFYGNEARPDYESLIRIAKGFGSLVRAEALVNDGVPKRFVTNFEQAGYRVVFSHAKDCDDRMVARTVAAHGAADTIIVGTGDHMIAKVLTLLKATGHQLVVAAVPQSISGDLLQIADAFIEIPVRRVHQQGISAGTAAYPDAA